MKGQPGNAVLLHTRRGRNRKRLTAREQLREQFSLPVRGVVLLLSLFLLFAHGCHGDEDTELLNVAGDKVVETTGAR